MNHLSLRSFRILFVIKRQLVLVLFYNLTQSTNTRELIIVLWNRTEGRSTACLILNVFGSSIHHLLWSLHISLPLISSSISLCRSINWWSHYELRFRLQNGFLRYHWWLRFEIVHFEDWVDVHLTCLLCPLERLINFLDVVNSLRKHQISSSSIQHCLVRVLIDIYVCHVLLQLVDYGLVQDLRFSEAVLIHNQTLVMLSLQLKVEETDRNKEVNCVFREKEGQSART